MYVLLLLLEFVWLVFLRRVSLLICNIFTASLKGVSFTRFYYWRGGREEAVYQMYYVSLYITCTVMRYCVGVVY